MINLKNDLVESALREVSQTIILPRFRNLHNEDISYKIGDDPVTIADKQAEIELSKRLLPLIPGSKLVGEEGFFENPSISDAFLGDSYVWIVDPIDGTRNFVAGRDCFGTIVSLAKQNQVIAAWHYNPFEDSFISGELGAGVFYKGRKLSLLPRAPLHEMRGNLGLVIDDLLKKRCAEGKDLPTDPKVSPSLLSCLYEYAQLFLESPDFGLKEPQWHFHAMYNYCSPWDNAAGVFFHQECGGFTAHWDGTPYKTNRYVSGPIPQGGYAQGFLMAPDHESWREIRDWTATLVPLPPSPCK